MPVPVTNPKQHKIPYGTQVAAMQMAVRSELRQARLSREGKLSEDEFVTQDPVMQSQLSIADQIAPMHMPVLIVGESGTGKDLMARRIGRRYATNLNTGLQEPAKYIAVNCAGITDTIFESEMFGHVRGSFTGASGDRVGFFAAADGGTLFLDEIGDLPMSQQAKILRVLQNKEVIPVGSTTAIPVNVRIVSATNKDLRKCIEEKTFREDLYYRLAKVIIFTTPLRDRVLDVHVIAASIITTNGWTPLGELSRPRRVDGDIVLDEGYDDTLIPEWAYSRGNVRRLEACLQSRELGLDWSEIAEQWNW